MSSILFKPDIFSNSHPEWKKTTLNLLPDLNTFLLYSFQGDFRSEFSCIEYSGGLEINSSNFRITFNGQSVLVKRWSKMIDEIQLEKIVGIMNWLADLNIQVPRPYFLKNGRSFIKIGEFYWSCFPFYTGDFFSGKGKELNNAALVTGSLTQALSELPIDLYPDRGPYHLSDEDSKILNEIDDIKNNWEDLFGIENSNLLKTIWKDLMNNWNKIQNEKKYAGPIIPVHFDLHPHNLIFKNSNIEAILDFESCKLMPVGYALSFAALKQCRQTIAEKKDFTLLRTIGKSYINNITLGYNLGDQLTHDFHHLCLAEIIRRICVIFRLNLNGNRDWNKILPIQLGHIFESEALFKFE